MYIRILYESIYRYEEEIISIISKDILNNLRCNDYELILKVVWIIGSSRSISKVVAILYLYKIYNELLNICNKVLSVKVTKKSYKIY